MAGSSGAMEKSAVEHDGRGHSIVHRPGEYLECGVVVLSLALRGERGRVSDRSSRERKASCDTGDAGDQQSSLCERRACGGGGRRHR